MKSREAAFRLMVSAVFFLVLGLTPQELLAQVTVTASPGYLTFGIPTGTLPATSAADIVTVNITGSGSVTFGSPSVSEGSPFTITGNSCLNPATTPANTFTAPTTCQISVTLSTSSTSLVTDTLNISYSGAGSPLAVPLSGAYGAIKLWDETNVTTSVVTASYTDLYTIASSGQNLSCPTSPPTATLSSTPGTFSNAVVGTTLGYVLVDNYVTLAISGSAVNTGNNPAGNVCSGGTADLSNGISYNNCFSTNYEVPAGTDYGLNGQNPDTFTNPGNGVLATQPGSPNNAGGVPPINVSSYFPTSETTPYPVQATFTALDSGYVFDTSTLFLVTNCSPAGIIPGGSVTLNAVSTTSPTSETQTAPIDNNPGQNILFTASDAVAIQQGTVTPTPVVPIVTDFAIPQQLFYQLVAGTSSAPAVCFRMSGELDTTVAPPAPMCKGFLLQCYNPADGTTSGDNCTPYVSSVRNLLFTAQFTSPDGPVNGFNYLYGPVGTPAADACTYYLNYLAGSPVPGGACATGTGPGLLLGSDNWLCAPGQGSPCTPPEPPVVTTTTPTSPVTYASSNCELTGVLEGASCPLDVLTLYQGESDNTPGGTKGGNSLYIPVANMPLPSATASIAGQNGNGWINNTSTTASFTSSAATYPSPAPATNPPANSFAAAAPYSLTYGVSPWPTLPDTTYPVAGDQTNSNTFTTSTICNNGGTTPNPFLSATPAGYFSSLSNGIYNLHYFTTDCAFTEGLVFQPTAAELTNATANWASFPFLSFGVDTVAPALSCAPTTSPVYMGWYNSNVTVSCNATDPAPGSGFAPGSVVPNTNNAVLQGSLSTSYNTSTNVSRPGTYPAVVIAQQQISDLAGNASNTQGPYTFAIDLQAPVITGPTLSPAASGNNYVVGSVGTVTITYSCNDGVGSGVASCTEVGALPAGSTTPVCTSTLLGELLTCTSSFTPAPTNVGSYSIYVSTVDNVGNAANSSATPLKFSVSDAPATVIFGALPASTVVPGNSLTYYVGAVDTNPANKPVSVYGADISVTLKMASGTLSNTTAPTAVSDVVACESWPCTVTPTTGAPCTVSSTATTVSISCNVGTIPDIFTSKSAVMVKIVVPTSKTAPAGSIAASGTITAVTPLSGITTFSASIPVK